MTSLHNNREAAPIEGGELIADPRDPRLLDASKYGALAVTAAVLRGLMRTAGRHGAEIVNASGFPPEGDVAHMPVEIMQETVRDMLASGCGERFTLPDGEHELVALRFNADGLPLSIVFVEDYAPAYPALVDSHLINRVDAIAAWLGDADEAEHPDLFPAGARSWR